MSEGAFVEGGFCLDTVTRNVGVEHVCSRDKRLLRRLSITTSLPVATRETTNCFSCMKFITELLYFHSYNNKKLSLQRK